MKLPLPDQESETALRVAEEADKADGADCADGV
jgi:hypothetical protein